MTTTITESVGTAAPSREGRMLVQIMTPGVGSSGVYPQNVIESAATARVFPAGTKMFADHPSVSESQDRPERSIRDLAGVLTQDAYWNGTGLVAEAKTYEPWATVLSEMHDAIGVSIRATARVEETDAQGRPIIAELVEGLSIDFVTEAGRGGKVLQVLESARKVTEALPGGLVANDLEQRLDEALGPESWVVDFTDEWVVYRSWESDERILVQQTYTVDPSGQIALTGAPVRVSRRVTYDAQIPPSSPAGVAMESHHQKKGAPLMGTISIDEAEHKRLTETADRVTALEAERDAANKKAQEAMAQIVAANEAADKADIERIIAGAGVEFTALEAKGLRADVPKDEIGRLDAPAFERLVKEAATEKAGESGHGRPTGFGPVAESTTITDWESYDKALSEISKGA